MANVSDSNVVWGNYNPKHDKNGEPEVIAKLATKPHKPKSMLSSNTEPFCVFH